MDATDSTLSKLTLLKEFTVQASLVKRLYSQVVTSTHGWCPSSHVEIR